MTNRLRYLRTKTKIGGCGVAPFDDRFGCRNAVVRGIEFDSTKLTGVVVQVIFGFRFGRIDGADPFFHTPTGTADVELWLAWREFFQ